MALFEDAAGTARSRVQPAELPAFDKARLRRARGLTRQGAFRKAAQALSSAPQAPKGEATVSLLQALHPPPTQGPKPDRAHLQSPLALNAEDIQASLRSFLRGSAPGASGCVTLTSRV
jgi:thioredoxin-like negative regulator of GroEL